MQVPLCTSWVTYQIEVTGFEQLGPMVEQFWQMDKEKKEEREKANPSPAPGLLDLDLKITREQFFGTGTPSPTPGAASESSHTREDYQKGDDHYIWEDWQYPRFGLAYRPGVRINQDTGEVATLAELWNSFSGGQESSNRFGNQ